jgi:protein-disulfide isomerase
MSFRATLTSALAGAVIAVASVYALSAAGLLPTPDTTATVRSYLLAHPDILVAMSNRLQEEQQIADDAARQTAVDKLGLKPFFDPKLAFITGPANAKTTFVEFFDYNCPFCRASNPAVEAFYNAHKKDARFAFIEFPIKGSASVAAARLAIAARSQPDKYLAYHFAMMRQHGVVDRKVALAIAQKVGLDVIKLRQDAQAASVTETINDANALAMAADIDGTPAFIVDGRMREGAVNRHQLAHLMRPRSS